jgi:retinoid hydroxylase
MGGRLSEAPTAPIAAEDLTSGEMPGLLARCAEELGPLFRWTVPTGPAAGREIVYLIGPEANRLALHTQRHAFSHDRGWTPIVGKALGRGLLNMDDPEHARHRKIWNPAFSVAYMDAYAPQMQRIIAERTARWAERGTVDLYREARELTFEIAAAALAGIERGPDMERLQRLFYTIISGSRSLGGSYDESVPRVLAARDELDAMLRELIARRRASRGEERPPNVLDAIIRARDEGGRGLPDDEVLGHLKILLVAGHETTTVLATYMLLLVARMDELRRHLEAEIGMLLGGAQADATALVGALRDMKALDLFIRETGRLHPPVHGLPRGVAQPVDFAGYTLPAGTRVYLSPAACHRLRGVFAHPDEFDAGRFAAPRAEDRRTPYSLVTFGGGPRLCIGMHFATVEVKLLAIHMLRHYRLEPLEEHLPVQVGLSATSLPGGVPVRVGPRRG